ncbi:hypothetical protein ACR777_00935 [Sphingobacterium spiritivorum]|uniref:hypothetical protein n=1 Tax=Sphingobacterium spiritivorum TaxID=258 RepID=UPI003DA6A292
MKPKFFLKYICIVIALTGCTKIEDSVTGTNPDEQEVILRLMMPQQNNRLTSYAIDDVDQNTIHTLDVLAFRIADDGKEIYAYRKKGVLLRPNPGATEVNFYANLLKSEDNYRFVLIANAATQLQNALSGLPVNADKETLMSRLTHSITTPWNASSTANFTPLSMWGESNVIHGISNSTQGFNVSMLRSLAAIDVTVSANDFEMTAVRVYNQPAKGRVAPSEANYDAENHKVTATSIPAGAGLLTQPAFYTANSENAVQNEIFLFERDAPANTGEPSATALVIQGKYAGSSTDTYYRIDLTDDNGKPMPVLRNHRYNIDITTVHGPGLTTETQAWNSRPVGMTAVVTAWNEVTIAGGSSSQYYLKVSMDSVTIKRSAQTLLLEVRANDLSAMTLTDIPNWMTVTRLNAPEKAIFTLKIPTYTEPKIARTAKLSVNLGRIKKRITIIQSPPPVDIGLPFLVSGSNLTGVNIPWYKRANVEYGLFSNIDASQTQKSGTPFSESCAALGEGYRLPTYNELIQLVPPGSSSQRDEIDSRLHQQRALPVNSTSGYVVNYLSSTARLGSQGLYNQYYALNNLSGGAGTNGVFSTVFPYKSGYTWPNEISRCVMSITDAPPL